MGKGRFLGRCEKRGQNLLLGGEVYCSFEMGNF